MRHEPDSKGWDWWTEQVGPQLQNKQAVMNAFANTAAFEAQAKTLYREVLWLISDHLGTPRLIAERTGKAEGIKRRDYLPFGEELTAGGRDATNGYTPASARQKFTTYERDDETGLDYAQARYYAGGMGRFISVDPLLASGMTINPQTWNRYAYSLNKPLSMVDPSGLKPRWYTTRYQNSDGGWTQEYISVDSNAKSVTHERRRYSLFNFGKAKSVQFTDERGVVTRLNRNGSKDELGVAIPKVTITGEDERDAIIGLSHGLVPGGKQLMDAVGVKANEDSPIYQNTSSIAGNVQLGVSIIGTSGAAIIWSATKKKSSVGNALGHWNKHKGEFSHLNNAKEYVDEATTFLTKPPSGALTKTRADGSVVVFDPASNVFGIRTASGTPRTMFKPDPTKHGYATNLDYFNAQ